MRLEEIKGIKEKRLQALYNAGIYTPVDLISFFPKKYIDVTKLTSLVSACDGDEVLLLACPSEQPKVSYIRKNMSVVKIKFTYDFKTVYVTYFNQPYIAKNIVVGKYYFISGKIKKQGGYNVPNATLIPFEENSAPIPVYSKIKGLPSSVLTSAIDTVLSSVTLSGYVSENLRKKHGLMEINEAYYKVHHPKTVTETALAAKTVGVEYLNYMISVYSIIREVNRTNKRSKFSDRKSQLLKFVQSLPYELTSDQTRALGQIVEDLHLRGCNRLLQGDVGCGKTAVAMCAMYYVATNNRQAVLMCPTEVLSRQHYQTALKYFEDFGVKVVLMCGSLKKTEREMVKQEIASGRADIVIGTHALFSDDVEFADLALVVTDEQQRFGVHQRSALENKAKNANILVMSATPIPRTLALTLYGELDVSTIKTMPKEKAVTYTRVVPKEKEDDMWDYVAKKAEIGEQTYVVCPRIEDEDESDLTSAKELFKRMSARFGDDIGILHGKLKDETKNRIMSDFAQGKTKILISTTVIEVGIDVKNATTMIVYNADRFGLSQLHQLRGRVGRGSKDSYCFVLSDNDSQSVKDRLGYFAKCADGFELAEYDFNVRGGGDFIGTGQHGKSGDFAVSSDNIRLAKQLSDEMLQSVEYRREIATTITDNRFEYFKNITLN